MNEEPLAYDPKDGPEELAGIWDESIKGAFASLREKQQLFLLAYVRCGNAAESYRQVYNPHATTKLAAACGSQALISKGIQTILKKLSDTRLEDLMLVKATFKDAAENAVKPIFSKDKEGQQEHVEDIPDYDIRVKAGDKLARLNRFYDDDEEGDPSNPNEKPKRTLTIGGVKVEIQ